MKLATRWVLTEAVIERIPLNIRDDRKREKADALVAEFLAERPGIPSSIEGDALDEPLRGLVGWIRGRGYELLDEALSPYAGTQGALQRTWGPSSQVP